VSHHDRKEDDRGHEGQKDGALKGGSSDAHVCVSLLVVFHKTIIIGNGLMYTVSDGGCRFFYSGLEGGLRDLREVDAYSP